MDNNSDIVFSGEGTVNNFGISVSGAGDINNDGFNDIIIGAEGYNSYTGRAYIYLGGNSIDNSVDLILTGEDTGNRFGSSVSSAGDVNNDGYDDIIVGAYAYNSATGRAYLFLGGSSINTTADIIFTGESTSNYFGTSVSGAGDVNNDEYDDIIIGAPVYNSLTGRTYIYFGGSSMNNVADLILDGDAADDEFGYSVSDADDVNNDGYDDVIIGAYGYSSNRGRVYIYFGGNPMDTSYDVYLAGTTNSYFGFSVSSAGDVNNDNYDDVIIGAYGTNSNTGRAYIYQGGNPMNSVSDLTLNGENTGNRFGYSVSGAGDINNDGFSDVVVGAYSHNLMGKAYLFFGADSMDNAADLTISGESNNNHFGFSVSEAGDVNGDGYNDIIIGASGYPVNGKAYVYSDPLAPLAVELTYFEGTKSQEGISLSWETATESNNFGFEIQRFQVQLVDVINLQSNEFVRIGFINGNGNSNSPKQYSFVDKSAIAGKVYIYRLKQIDFDGNYEYSDIIHVELNNLPTKFSLSQNYPNPFNPSTSIEYSIPSSVYVSLTIYDVLGNKVAELVNERKEAGIYKINFDGNTLTSGIYIYKLQAGSFIETKKLMVLK